MFFPLLLSLCCGATDDAASDRPPPNIVLISAESLGYSDLSCYGGDIRTPNLDRLAVAGLRFSRFYNAGENSASQAALLTGLYPHQAGLGYRTQDWMRPGYRGNLNSRCATLAQLLRTAGYQTYLCGTWHVTKDVGPEAPKSQWPTQRGFERFFGTVGDVDSYFEPALLVRDNGVLRPTGDFYYPDALAQQASEYLQLAVRNPKPFFLYVAFPTPHWPLQARPEALTPLRGRYVLGWDDLRKDRYRRLIAAGMIHREWPLCARDPEVAAWDRTTAQAWQQRRMEVYAAQVQAVDEAVGRVVERLDQLNARTNTLIVFVSTSGAAAEELDPAAGGTTASRRTRGGQTISVGNAPNVQPGPVETYQSYGRGWAQLSNTPFRMFAGATYEGGISSPLIISWPAVIRQPGIIIHYPGHMADLAATFYAVARMPYPQRFAAIALTPLEGESLLPLLLGKARTRGPIFWEHAGNRAVLDGKWKIVAPPAGEWELYDMATDRTETTDLAQRFRAIVKDLSMSYDEWAKRAGVEAWDPDSRKR